MDERITPSETSPNEDGLCRAAHYAPRAYKLFMATALRLGLGRLTVQAALDAFDSATVEARAA
jgi:hypothetical protein